MRKLSSSQRSRTGFTLIELLVVISILLVLAAMTAGAYFRVSAGQGQKRSENVVRGLQLALNAQRQAAIADIKKEIASGGVPASVLSLAGNDRDLANVLWLKMRLVQEFPTNFSEALNPVPGYLNAKNAYSQYLSGMTSSTGTTSQQCAVCLYMVLTLNRRGASFTPDDLGSGATAQISIGSSSFPVFIDAWWNPSPPAPLVPNPITYERWSTDSNALSALAIYAVVNPGSTSNSDPEDPLNKIPSSWYPPPGTASPPSSIPTVLQPGLTGKYTGPVVRSWGRDATQFTADDILGILLTVQGQRGN